MSFKFSHLLKSDHKAIEPSTKLIDKEINSMWIYFMKAFEYEHYYDDDILFKDDTFSYSRLQYSRPDAIKMLNDFFNRQKIFYSENFNVISNNPSDEKISQRVLSNAKLWIMYIIIMSKSVDLSSIVQIFSNALQNRADPVMLFEFFLIFISGFSTDIDEQYDFSEITWPQEFINIYKENKETLTKIFQDKQDTRIKDKGCDSKFNQSFSNYEEFSFNFNKEEEENNSNSEKNNMDQCFEGIFSMMLDSNDINKKEEDKLKQIIEESSSDAIMHDELINDTEIEVIDKSPLNINTERSNTEESMNKSPTLDRYLVPTVPSEEVKEEELLYTDDNLLIIDKDFINHGFFAILQPVGSLKQVYSQYDYIITPLKKNFNGSFQEKTEVEKVLVVIRTSVYENFIYIPYNPQIVALLSDS